jgi:hypothetical protein
LAGLNDFYLPGRDYSSLVEQGGMGIILLSILGVFGHGIMRIVSCFRKNECVESENENVDGKS